MPFSTVSIVDFEQVNVNWKDIRTTTFGYCFIAFTDDSKQLSAHHVNF